MKNRKLISLSTDISFLQLISYFSKQINIQSTINQQPQCNECRHKSLKNYLIRKLSINLQELYSLSQYVYLSITKRKYQYEVIQKITKNIFLQIQNNREKIQNTENTTKNGQKINGNHKITNEKKKLANGVTIENGNQILTEKNNRMDQENFNLIKSNTTFMDGKMNQNLKDTKMMPNKLKQAKERKQSQNTNISMLQSDSPPVSMFDHNGNTSQTKPRVSNAGFILKSSEPYLSWYQMPKVASESGYYYPGLTSFTPNNNNYNGLTYNNHGQEYNNNNNNEFNSYNLLNNLSNMTNYINKYNNLMNINQNNQK